MNVNQIMKQAQSMQKKIKELQDEIAVKEFEGNAGGGLVSIVISGSGQMKKANIDLSLLQENEKEMLEDLIVAAHNDAKTKAERDSRNSMDQAFGGIGGLPPGFSI